jgi:hypothetical protein
MTPTAPAPVAIDYDPAQNRHSAEGPQVALPSIFPNGLPSSVLDVGCGPAVWLRALAQAGVPDYMGVDGVDIPPGDLLVDRNRFVHMDLVSKWDLGRRFEAALCLEVGEHLDPDHAGLLIDALVRHADLIVFSAACPGQPGQHHVNCRWPSYWQGLFNARGYTCSDDVRWRLWDVDGVEPWYKQNMFIARKSPSGAGAEPRLRSVVHPDMLSLLRPDVISGGNMPASWYFQITASAFNAKFRRKLGSLFGK